VTQHFLFVYYHKIIFLKCEAPTLRFRNNEKKFKIILDREISRMLMVKILKNTYLKSSIFFYLIQIFFSEKLSYPNYLSNSNTNNNKILIENQNMQSKPQTLMLLMLSTYIHRLLLPTNIIIITISSLHSLILQ
jgi:hypothetical protein